MKRRIRNLLGLLAEDNRAMGSGGAAAGVAGIVVIVAAVTAGVASPSGSAGPADPQSQVNVVEDGLEDSLEDTNNKVISKDQQADQQPSRRFAAKIKQAIPEHAWNNMPSATRQQLTQQVGGFMTQVDAQSSIDSELTQVRTAGDGIVRGATLKQHGTGEHTITDKVQETYTVQEQRIDHWEQYVDHYKQKITGYRKVQVGTKQVQVGTTTEMKPYQESYQVPIYDTRTYTEYKPETYTVRVRHTRQVYVGTSDCYSGWGGCSPEYRTEVYYTTETRTRWVKKMYTERYIDHYETRYETKWKKVETPVYETRPVYERQAVTTQVPVYDQRPVYKTVNIEKTRTKTVEQKVKTAPFVLDDGTNDWTLATDVKEFRDATMRIEKTDLTEDKSNAFELIAASETTNEEWRMKVWKDNGDVVIQTNNGIQRRAGGDFVEINFDEGTINGQEADLQLARGIDSQYTLKVKNGDSARGTYEMTVAGKPSIDAQAADIANDEAGVTVVDGVVYSATFDVTYKTKSTTYTDRIVIEPPVNLKSSERASA